LCAGPRGGRGVDIDLEERYCIVVASKIVPLGQKEKDVSRRISSTRRVPKSSRSRSVSVAIDLRDSNLALHTVLNCAQGYNRHLEVREGHHVRR